MKQVASLVLNSMLLPTWSRVSTATMKLCCGIVAAQEWALKNLASAHVLVPLLSFRRQKLVQISQQLLFHSFESEHLRTPTSEVYQNVYILWYSTTKSQARPTCTHFPQTMGSKVRSACIQDDGCHRPRWAHNPRLPVLLSRMPGALARRGQARSGGRVYASVYASDAGPTSKACRHCSQVGQTLNRAAIRRR